MGRLVVCGEVGGSMGGVVGRLKITWSVSRWEVGTALLSCCSWPFSALEMCCE